MDGEQDLYACTDSAIRDFIEMVHASQDAMKIARIKPATDFIEAYYDRPLTVADVAEAAALSASRLGHLFREQMGITVIDYLTRVRIGHARRLLLTTKKSCSQIGFEVGYNNQSHFTRTFKDAIGMTPREFREQNRRPDGGAKKESATA